MNRRRALDEFLAAWRGDGADHFDWPALVQLAADELVLTELESRVDLSRVPAEVATLLSECARRNAIRNSRLRATLSETLVLLNQTGIEPVLLKGCALWGLQQTEPWRRGRIVSDLDILVEPAEMDIALQLLTSEGGFAILADKRTEARHPVVELGRGADVGVLDLHQRAPGSLTVPTLHDLHAHCSETVIDGGRARVPPVELQILISALHDQLNDGAIVNGSFNLRHLLDIAEMSQGPAPVDWVRLLHACPSKLARTMVASQLCAANAFFDVQAPEAVLREGRACFRRQRFQFYWPAINKIPRALGLNRKVWRPLAQRLT